MRPFIPRFQSWSRGPAQCRACRTRYRGRRGHHPFYRKTRIPSGFQDKSTRRCRHALRPSGTDPVIGTSWWPRRTRSSRTYRRHLARPVPCDPNGSLISLCKSIG